MQRIPAPTPDEARGVPAADAGFARLATLALPDEAGIRRDHVIPAALRGPDFDARYDFRTLAYDAIHLPGRGVLTLVCPPLLNLAQVLRRGEILVDGQPVRPGRIRRRRRFDFVDLPCPNPPATLAVRFEGWQVETSIPEPAAAPFAGRNCLLTVSRDNALRWIGDWARFHVREQGADAVLFFDNGSTEYGPGDVLDALASVEGLAAVRVAPVPLPFGPIPRGGSRSRALFLQSALWNVARLRFLAGARAVLPCDVDELVTGRGGRSVFDAAVASRAGLVAFCGTWRAYESGEGLPLHRDHDRLPLRARPCPRKYCVVPGRALGRLAWNTHSLVGLPFPGLFESPDFSYLHCHGISTRWKSANSRRPVDPGPPDPATARILARALPDARDAPPG